MTSEQIINEFFARKGGIQWVNAPVPQCDGNGNHWMQVKSVSQVIYISDKQANWLQSVAKREGVTRQNHQGHTVGKMADGAEWSLFYPHKNSRQKVPSLQIVSV